MNTHNPMNPTPRSNAADGTSNAQLTAYRKRLIVCYGLAESGQFAQLDNGDRLYGISALAPEMAQTIQDVLDWTDGDIEAHLELDADADLGHLYHRATRLRAILARLNGEGGAT